ncbi:MAG: hypothetical protein Q8O42_23460 [Acidobacteriota bacterium]|nr:hypothetical protein [Acidobacteriota bacterium]
MSSFDRAHIQRAAVLGSLLFAVVTGYGCGETPTSPTTVETTTTTATTETTPVFTEDWMDTLAVGGERFYSFTVTQTGTVNVSLTSVSGQFVPATVTVGLGLGTPVAETCATTLSISTQAGAGPHLTGTYNPGVYCVKVWDVGNLFAPALFAITVAYP